MHTVQSGDEITFFKLYKTDVLRGGEVKPEKELVMM